MTLNELKSLLTTTCNGKVEYIEALQTFIDKYIESDEDDIRHYIEYEDLNISDPLMDGNVDCCNCPFNGDDNWSCADNIDLPSDITAEEFNAQFLDVLKTALAVCKSGENEVAKPPREAIKPPLPIINTISDLVGLHSTDGKFRIDRDSSGFGNNGYEVVGILSSYPYYQFQELNFEVEQILGELGFQFTIQERKSYIEMLNECEGVEFEFGKTSFYIVVVEDNMVSYWEGKGVFIPTVKYISKEDAERIVRECKENKEELKCNQ